MPLDHLALALLALLLTPGPTNTLIAVAGAERGWFGALRLIPAEVAGYLAAVVPLALSGAALFAALPQAQTAVTVLAAAWVAVLALRLWRVPAAGTAGAVTARRVAVTTCLNPKALVIGLALFPGGALLPQVAVFVVLIAAVAATWAALGAGLAGTGLPRLRRLAALWLAVLSLGLAARAVAG